MVAVVIGLPVGMFLAMGKSGYLDTGDTGKADEVILAGVSAENAHVDPFLSVSTLATSISFQGDGGQFVVIASILEKRSHAGGGEGQGYWLEGDVITVSWACMNEAGDVWIAFAGGWSAARYQGREFVSPLPVVTEVCGE